MTWIQKQWDHAYFEDAVVKIKQTVRLFLFYISIHLSQIHRKMIEYCAQATSPKELSGPSSPAAGGNVPAYMSLSEQYGLVDDDMDIASSVDEQTVEQEYQAYITAPLSPKTIDMVKFWEASDGASRP